MPKKREIPFPTVGGSCMIKREMSSKRGILDMYDISFDLNLVTLRWYFQYRVY